MEMVNKAMQDVKKDPTYENYYVYVAEQNVKGYIMHFLQANKIKYDPKTGYIKAGSSLDPELLLNMIYMRYSADLVNLIRMCNSPKEGEIKKKAPARMEKERFKEVLEVYEYEEKEKLIQVLRNEICFLPGTEVSGLDELRKYTKNLTGRDSELDVAALYHFIWQVKRKIWGRLTEWHLMPIFFTPGQGKAKSRNVERISLIVSSQPQGTESNLMLPFCCEINGDQMTDERSFRNFKDSYIGFNDEFGRLNKKNYTEAKRIISSLRLQYRPMRTNKSIAIMQNTTFIGTSNEPLNEVVFDQSGVRRFYQLNVQSDHTADSAALQQQVAESIDYLQIWRSVDESKSYRDSWQFQFQEEFAKVAEDARVKDDLELFTEDYNIKPGAKKVAVAIIYRAFREFMFEEGIKWDCSSNKFSVRLKNKGLEKIHTNKGDMWLVNEDWGKPDPGADAFDEFMDPEELRLTKALDLSLANQDYLQCAEIQKRLASLKNNVKKNGLY
jgi:hypothetical protein